MKYHETTFEDYMSSNESRSLHPSMERNYAKYPERMEDMHNMIFYGPAGCGKYTQVLRFLKRYSPSDLKYEKRVAVTSNKVTGYYKISDVHMEVDMGMLGCNSKVIWHDLFVHLNDMLNAKARKLGFVVCKNFHEIHNELLDIFYSYMQGSAKDNPIKFIMISESVSFIPDNIMGCCEVVNVPRPSRSAYSACVGRRIPTGTEIPVMENIKNLKDATDVMDMYDAICDKIVVYIEADDISRWVDFRDCIYDMFTYNVDVHKCVWKILSRIITKHKLTNTGALMDRTYAFLKLFNNNYRPIYHLEGYFLFLKRELMRLDEGVLLSTDVLLG